MNDKQWPSGGAKCPSHNKGEQVCGNTDSQMVTIEASDVVVSHAISPAVSLNNGREKLITETKSNKSGNQSCSNSAEKPDCYQCVYRGIIPGDAHSTCKHPIFDVVDGGKFLPALFMMYGRKSPFEKRLNITYIQHGFDNGWFMWPINFDPVWLETCNGFKKNEP